LAGTIVPTINKDGLVCVDMGEPVLKASDVPCTLSPTTGEAAVDAPIVLGHTTYMQTAVSMGNPHSVIFVDSLDGMDPPFETVGPLAEAHEAWPSKANAEFVEVYTRSHVRVMVWERGAGPTFACGTGACAVCVAGVLTGRTDRDVKVTLPGGELQIRWDADSNKVFMTGPAVETFRGSVRNLR
jgi:diaminopimelate epimerase